jgi:hypothetical protein
LAAVDDFALLLCHGVSWLEEQRLRTVSEWHPDLPPPTVLLGALGQAIAEEFDEIPPDLRRRVFDEIELGACDPRIDLSTAVATGLIEAMIFRAMKRPELFNRVMATFGPTSRQHALVMSRF